MNGLLQIFSSALMALFCTCWIHPYILKVAKTKNIVDNPDARKLQRIPVPILGGLTVIFGVLSGLMAFNLIGEPYNFFPLFTSIVIILIIGLIDDMISLSAKVRFAVEILLVIYLIYTTGYQLNDFHGLWGVHQIDNWFSIPLTVFACVGIINAVNLIDGVDGYSSGYSIVSCILFGAMFYTLGNICMVALAAIVAASLLPFFLHNVFGKLSKMFIGDAGTLSLGIIFSVFVTTILSAEQIEVELPDNLGLIPFTLAVLCIPVFDTLRVMSARLLKGKSPFSPDKTHLHHLFIELGYSHIGTTLSIICMNLFVVLCWFLAFMYGLSIDVQLYMVLTLGLLVTFIFYPVVKAAIRKKSRLYLLLRNIAKLTRGERKGFWLLAQRLADRSVSDTSQE
ncbi:MAG: undecaprenyl/decaprenyl-phosphate alpha-N-acetylglucosaminyl 1-phosphate transferase [Bacteroides sp.]|nr:undecaprenyl/decaprenyl-phosphate alpha-N-acetylglucosaminyl 1-phosphate transferase [Bacteroides sp.]